ncbi:glycosyltransferase family 87 protein [Streptomyces sp. NPDC004609]|uniref:glycosyltransferase family 87 protein n=1 Tax=Streptomyces sp. NPDC004609 TaxID=3364704 RepID=UPI0036BB9295
MWRVPLVATAVAVPLYVLWAGWLATGGGDLAAQLAWTGFTERHPSSAYNLSWYGGMHTANYSLLAPPLMAVFGVRAVSVAAGLLATWALARLVVRSGVTRPLWPALAGTGALWANIASGRTTFALGVAIALLALLYVRRPVLAGVCAALATMASPVAGLFLVVAGAAYLLDRRWRPAVALVVPPALVVAVTTLLFPFKGEMPMQAEKLWLPLVVSAAVALTAPREWRVVRYGALVYGLGVVLTYVIPSPIGRNVERLAGLAGPPVLLAAVVTGVSAAGGVAAFLRAGGGTGPGTAPPATAGAEAGAGGDAGRGGRARTLALRFALVAALAVNTNWLIDKTEDDLAVSNKVPSWAANTGGVVRELERLGADRTRVEVVPARNHREATVLAPHINMARGWNRQLDVERGRLFYDGSLDPRTYRAWLDHWAVGYVVLHHGRPDGPARGEAAIVQSEPPWLERVWRDDGWTIYRVRDAVPLVSSPATVVRADAAELVVRMPAAGSVTVRVAHSPWLRAEGACLRQAGEWTRLTVDRPGDYTLASPYRFPRSSGAAC